MSDFLNKLEEIKIYNESLFGNMFGKKKPAEEDNDVKQIGKFSYDIGGNIAEKIYGASVPYVLAYDWKNGELNWLTNASWEGLIEIDLNKEKLIGFSGEWYGGFFEQGTFRISSNSAFFDGTFHGRFMAAYTAWKTKPTNFLGGVVGDGKNGILGMPNITKLSIDRTDATQTKRFNLIQLPAGTSVIINNVDNIQYIIKVNKRLDDKNSVFSYSISDSQGKSWTSRFDWTELRTTFEANTNIGIKSSSIPLLGLKNLGKIKSIKVEETSAASMVSKIKPQRRFETIKWRDLRGLGISAFGKHKTNYQVRLSLPAEDVVLFDDVMKNIKLGQLQSDLEIIRKGIRSCKINGYSVFPFFRNIFNGRKGRQPAIRMLDKRPSPYYNAMFRVNRFLDIIIGNMITSKGVTSTVSNIKAIHAVETKLKDLLQVENLENCVVRNEKDSKTTLDNLNNSEEESEPPLPGAKFQGRKISEAIRKEVQKILLDNF